MAIGMNLPFSRLFVLGAGFSKPAGLPLAKETSKPHPSRSQEAL